MLKEMQRKNDAIKTDRVNRGVDNILTLGRREPYVGKFNADRYFGHDEYRPTCFTHV